MKIMRTIKKFSYSLIAFIPASSFAQLQGGVESAKPVGQDKEANVPTNLWNWLNDFTNIMLFLAGAIAVIVIIFGGVRYITSTGDPARVKQAKDTIVYGIIGLIVAILAYAIVRFVTTQLK